MHNPSAANFQAKVRTTVLALALTSLATGMSNAEGLPDPGFEIEAGRTALPVTDPQIDFLSPGGVAWGLDGYAAALTNFRMIASHVVDTASPSALPMNGMTIATAGSDPAATRTGLLRTAA